MIKITSRRLIIRDFKEQDILPYVDFRRDLKFQRFYSEIDASEDKSMFLVHAFIEQAKIKSRTMFQLAVTQNNKLIGSCGIRLDNKHQASIGCEMSRSWQKSGYAYEAATELIMYGFKNLSIHRIYAETITDNRAAIKLCTKLGMRKEAEFVEHQHFKDRWWNTSIYALLKREWEC